jgi:uncharacterized membrane protein
VHAVLIDPATQTISNVDYNGQIEHMYKLLNVDVVEVVDMGAEGDLWVDEEGLFKVTPATMFIVSDLLHQPIAGRGLILGVNADGETIAAPHDADYYRDKFTYTPAAQIKNDARWKIKAF